MLDTQHGQDVRKLLKAGVIRKMSFGFQDLDKRWLDQREDVERYWDSVGYEPDEEDKERCRKRCPAFHSAAKCLRHAQSWPLAMIGPTSPKCAAGCATMMANLGDDGEMSVCKEEDKWYVKTKKGKLEPC